MLSATWQLRGQEVAKYLAIGGRLDSLETIGTVTENTQSGSFDSAYADCSIMSGTTTGIWTLTFRDNDGVAIDLADGETGYFHFDYFHGSGVAVSNNNLVTLYDSAGFPWFAFRQPSNGVYGLYYNSGSGASPVWSLVGITVTLTIGLRYPVDIKLTLNSAGSHIAEWSANSSLQSGGTFVQASLTSLRSMRGHGANANEHFSQLLVTEGISTIGGKVRYSRPTGAGSNAGWSGTFADVNEAVNSDVTLNASTAAGQKTTYAMGDVAVPAGFKIGAVEHALRGKNDGAAPANIKSVVRSGGVDYASANLGGISTPFGPLRRRLITDPATAAGWTQAGWNAAEAGYESAA